MYIVTRFISIIVTIAMLISYSLPITDGFKLFRHTDFIHGWSNYNNGYPNSGEDVERLISVKPSPLQKKFEDIEYYSFIHYGMNTFTDSEWGTGKENPSQYCPETVDTDQWCRVLKASGSKGIILTAKHHDGFCLFQTKYTEHSIKNSPYKDGKGDIVAQLAESCKKYGLKLGLYLSPWDRHEETYGTEAYNDFFVNQLTELCTNYGEIFSFWFDGAKGEDAPDFTYDFERYYKVIRELQPNAVISVCGPDIRWIGNESGMARKSEWSVITSGSASAEKTMEDSQHSESEANKLQEINGMNEDLGSRELVLKYRDLIWKQAEADVSIDYNWFYHEKSSTRTAKQLADIYFNTVGGNALMLLNIPPSTNGIIEEKHVKILEEFKSIVDSRFANKLDFEFEGNDKIPDSIKTDGSYMLGDKENLLTLKLDSKQKVKTIVIREDTSFSQRVEAFEVYSRVGHHNYVRVYCGTTIGSKKIIRLLDNVIPKTDEIKIVFTQSRSNPVIRTVELYG